MHDLLSKYLTGDISSEEKQTLFLLLKENTELKKEAADIQNLSALVSMVREEHPASDMQYRSFVHLRKKRTFLFNMRKIAGYAAIMVFSVLSTYLLMTNENPFSMTCEKQGAREGTVNHFALNDFKVFYDLFHYDFRSI